MPRIPFPLLFFGVGIVPFVAHEWTQMLALDFQTPDSPHPSTGGARLPLHRAIIGSWQLAALIGLLS